MAQLSAEGDLPRHVEAVVARARLRPAQFDRQPCWGREGEGTGGEPGREKARSLRSTGGDGAGVGELRAILDSEGARAAERAAVACRVLEGITSASRFYIQRAGVVEGDRDVGGSRP